MILFIYLFIYFLIFFFERERVTQPEVVKKMTTFCPPRTLVSDWLQRTDTEGNDEQVMVGVNECNAFFVLSKEEEAWFDVYYEYLRSVMIKRRHGRCSLDEAEKFFMRSSGNPVDNPSEDLKKLHDEYRLPSITTDKVISSVHTAVYKLHLTDDEKLSRYFSYWTGKEEKPLSSSAGSLSYLIYACSPSFKYPDQYCFFSPAEAPEPQWMNANMAFCLLKMSHPVTVHAAPPEREARVQISRKFESDCLSLWCVTQKKLCERLVLDTFGPRQPSESKVHSWIEKQGWMENVPDAAEVVKDWKPSRSIQAPTDSKWIRRMSRRQCWKGLQLMDREGKGLRVVTSRPFACGEVICDFHGRLISRDEGLSESTLDTGLLV
ncbi:N-lysine methyltransferase KMT5A-A [Labeo rohita]|uniref:N-lysine methyltransferase KMT5A-A n=1 Tax=Labeo rohita TaxID=84645 RepID=A0ABQ8L0R7_LABRO|nr:N-lysine methyltransferase KMT5A-A [Labeo rohita]